MKNRHTVSYLTNRLGLAGAKPQRRFGQNFLIDLNLIELITRSAEVGGQDLVLEVGAGTGSLTSHLAEVAAQVITVEVDPFMQQIAAEELAEYSNVTILNCDALESKHTVNAQILDLVQATLARNPNWVWKLVANLPYNIATPLIANLFELPNPPVQMVVTIQLELAQRIVASPSTSDYGALSVWIQSQADCSLVRKLPPHVFWPRPNVDSAVLRIVRNDAKRARFKHVGRFHEFIKAIFQHRRKTLRGQLQAYVKSQAGAEESTSIDIDAVLQRLGISKDARAEQLNIEQIVQLNECLSLESLSGQ